MTNIFHILEAIRDDTPKKDMKWKYVLAAALLILGAFIGPLPLIVGSILVLAGWHDWRKHEVPDLLTAGLWVTTFVAGFFGLADFGIIVGSFAFLYFITIAWAVWKGTPAMGWADVLALPPFFGIMWTYGAVGVVSAAAGLFLFDYVSRKKGGPLLPFMAAAFWACVLASAVI